MESYKYEHTRQISGGESLVRGYTKVLREKERKSQESSLQVHRKARVFRQEVKIQGVGARSNPPEFKFEDQHVIKLQSRLEGL